MNFLEQLLLKSIMYQLKVIWKNIFIYFIKYLNQDE